MSLLYGLLDLSCGECNVISLYFMCCSVNGCVACLTVFVNCLVKSDEDVCCSVMFNTLVGVFMFSVTWSELLMTSAISCPLWSSVYECQRVECAFTSPVRTECGMFVMCCM